MCKLSYPRSGSSSVESLKRLRLPSTKPGDPPPVSHKTPVFLKHGLFKEEIQDRSILKIEVLDRDDVGKVAKFFLAIFNTILSTVLGGLVKGAISHEVVGAVANLGVAKIGGAYQLGKGVSLDSSAASP